MIPEDAHCQATEDDVVRALAGAPFQGWPQDEAELLQLFNTMLKVIAERQGFTSDAPHHDTRDAGVTKH